MRVRARTLVLLWLMLPLVAAYGDGDVDWLDPIIEPLATVGRPDVQELTDAQVAAAESICHLSGLYRPVIVAAVKRHRMGASVFAVADWHFRNQYLEQACLLYELALEDTNSCGDHPALCAAMTKTARYRIALVRDNNDFGAGPLRLYVEAISCGNHITERQMLERIKQLYPESKIVDDVDFGIGTRLYPRDRSELARYWEEFLKTHSDSPLRDEADERLTIVYYDLGLKAAANDEPLEAGRWFRPVTDRPAVLDGYAYGTVAEFFESRGELVPAEQAYVKGLYQSGPETHAALALFYERHYGLAAYIRFLLDRGADEREIQKRLADVEQMRGEIEPKQGSS